MHHFVTVSFVAVYVFLMLTVSVYAPVCGMARNILSHAISEHSSISETSSAVLSRGAVKMKDVWTMCYI